MAGTIRTLDNSGNRFRDILGVDGLQSRSTPAKQWKDRQGPEETGERCEEMVIRREHDRRPHNRRARKGLLDDYLAFAACTDVVRGRSWICTDTRDVDQALHASLACK